MVEWYSSISIGENKLRQAYVPMTFILIVIFKIINYDSISISELFAYFCMALALF